MSAPASGRIRAIDWMRGLVMVLMTIDHASHKLNAGFLMKDSAFGWEPGTPLPWAQFLTRWITHLCAPTFVLLAGASLALSTEKRRDQPGQTAFIVKRGLLIAALDPLWMTLAFTAYEFFVLQVLYAIGISLVCMAFLRKLSSRTLLVIGVAIQAFGELTTKLPRLPHPLDWLLQLTFTGGPLLPPFPLKMMAAYPFVPWLSMMIFGWLIGRWLIANRAQPNRERARLLFALGSALLALFIVIRGLDGYGNWGLHRDSLAPLQWIHVAKYPPSLSYSTLELGIGLLLLAGFFRLDDASPRAWLGPLSLFGATAFFFYLLHAHLIAAVALLMHIEPGALWHAYAGAGLVLLVLYPLCARYRRYKQAHPDGWTRYI